MFYIGHDKIKSAMFPWAIENRISDIHRYFELNVNHCNYNITIDTPQFTQGIQNLQPCYRKTFAEWGKNERYIKRATWYGEWKYIGKELMAVYWRIAPRACYELSDIMC